MPNNFIFNSNRLTITGNVGCTSMCTIISVHPALPILLTKLWPTRSHDFTSILGNNYWSSDMVGAPTDKTIGVPISSAHLATYF